MSEEKIETQDGYGPAPVKRPKVIYIAALWSFFGIAGFISIYIRVATQSNPVLSQVFSLFLIIFIILFIMHIVKMRRFAIVSFGIACIFLALYNFCNIIFLFSNDRSSSAAIALGFFYAIPSVILAAIVLRPSFLKLSDQYNKFRKCEAERISALKKSLREK